MYYTSNSHKFSIATPLMKQVGVTMTPYLRWPTAPFKGYLGAFSGPAISGQDPSTTLIQETAKWTQRLAQQAHLGEDAPGVTARRAEFLSVHGGGRDTVDPLTGHEVDTGITLCHVLLTTNRGIWGTV